MLTEEVNAKAERIVQLMDLKKAIYEHIRIMKDPKMNGITVTERLLKTYPVLNQTLKETAVHLYDVELTKIEIELIELLS